MKKNGRKTRRSKKKQENNIYRGHGILAGIYILSMILLYLGITANFEYSFCLNYGEEYDNTAELYYNTGDWFTESQCIRAEFNKEAVFPVNHSIYKNTLTYRIDPVITELDSDFLVLRSFSIVFHDTEIKTYQKKSLLNYISTTNDIGELKLKKGNLIIPVTGDDPYWVFSKEFTESVSEEIIANNERFFLWYAALLTVVALLLGVVLYFRKNLPFYPQLLVASDKLKDLLARLKLRAARLLQREEKLSAMRRTGYVLAIVLFVAAIIVFTLRRFLVENFNGLSMAEIVFHLKVPLTGTGTDMIEDYFSSAKIVFILAGSILVLSILLLIFRKNVRNLRLVNVLAVWIPLLFLVGNLVRFSQQLNLIEYIANQMSVSTFIEENYISPEDTTVSFPEQKRNLIYIYLESMESTFISREEGGCMPEDLIPELTELAQDNVNFSENDRVGGATSSYGSEWTVGAMVAQSCGLPLLIPIDGNAYGEHSEFLPGATSLGDILESNGYVQEIMVGSDLSFGGRSNFFSQHGDYQVYDLYTAREREDLPDDYKVWWGYEDTKLFSYAKEELRKLAEGSSPFNLTMLTADTHHIGGYVCKYCKDEHESQYENVLSCSSRQVADFVSWIMEQDFYKDTTIVISGDHPTMDSQYIETHYDGSRPRKVYNCFINAAGDDLFSKNREFNTFDLFPTTLAAMGCEIEGERLGLGTNLFSGQQTLAEIYGLERIDSEFSRISRFYESEILGE